MPQKFFKITWKGAQIGTLMNLSQDMGYMKGTWNSFQDQIAVDFEAEARKLDAQEVMKDPFKGILVKLRPINSATPLITIVYSLDQDNSLFVRLFTDLETQKILLEHFEPGIPSPPIHYPKLEDFYLEATETTPEISFKADTGEIKIFGDFYHQDSLAFFEPIFGLLKKYTVRGGRKINFHIKMEFFNTIASRRLLEIMNLLEDYCFNKNGDVNVYSYYKKDDKEMLEVWKEYAEDCKLKFILIPY